MNGHCGRDKESEAVTDQEVRQEYISDCFLVIGERMVN